MIQILAMVALWGLALVAATVAILVVTNIFSGRDRP
jgi:hypothetical protein